MVTVDTNISRVEDDCIGQRKLTEFVTLYGGLIAAAIPEQAGFGFVLNQDFHG